MRREAVESPGFDITVDRDAEIPIGVQLAWALRSRVRDGQLTPGQRLPGLREMAEASGVNVNTVRAVYQRLEREGLIDSQQGSGTFVAPTPTRPSTVSAIAADAAREAYETGVDPREVAAALYVAPGSPSGSGAAAPARRRVLREQIAALERTLGEMEAKHPGVAPPSAQPDAELGPTLLDATELERVRTALVRRLATVQGAVDRLGVEEPGEREGAVAIEQRRPAPTSGRAARARATMRPAPEGA